MKRPSLLAVLFTHCTFETFFGVVMTLFGAMNIKASMATLPEGVESLSSMYGLPIGVLCIVSGVGILGYALSKAKGFRG